MSPMRLFRVIRVSVNSAAFCRRRYQQEETTTTVTIVSVSCWQWLGVCLSTMKFVVDGSLCHNQHFLVGITCRNRA